MFKKLILLAALLFSAGALYAKQPSDSDKITLLIMPGDAVSIQIGQDLSRRYPVLLVSYQKIRGELKLHAWNGERWLEVTEEDYAKGVFFTHRPSHAILVEAGYVQAPAVLTPCRAWCPNANRLTSTDPRVMIHLLGLYFKFPFDYWKQFALRYNFALEDINPSMYNVYWWNSREGLPKKSETTYKLSDDLKNWRYLRTLPIAKIDPFGVSLTARNEAAKTNSVATNSVATNSVQTTQPVELKVSPEIVPSPVSISTSAPPVVLSNKTVQVETQPIPLPAPVVKPAPVITPEPAAKPVLAVFPAPLTNPAPVVATVAPVKTAATNTPKSIIKPAVGITPEPVTKPVPAVIPAPLTNPAPVVATVAPVKTAVTNIHESIIKTNPVDVIKPVAEAIPTVSTNQEATTIADSELIPVSPDPFSSEEMPAAEVILVPETKKSWWK